MQESKETIAISAGSGFIGALIGIFAILYVANSGLLNLSLTQPANQQVQITSPSSVSSTMPVPASQQTIQDWDNYITTVVERSESAVVAIGISKNVQNRQLQMWDDPFFDNFFNDPFFGNIRRQPQNNQQNQPQYTYQRIGGGSGFLVTSDGLIVTNRHVVSDDKADYTVVTFDGKEYPAKVLARDPVLDLAYIKIDGQDFPHLDLGDSDKLKLGQTVLAIGNALDEFRNTVTQGIISGINRHITAGSNDGVEEIDGAIQTDAAINPGNSGGPLLNLNGQVIGINTAVSTEGQLIGFALPSNVIKRGLDQVQKTGKITRAFLGVRYQVITDDLVKKNNLSITHGVIISRGRDATELAVIPGSPADKAGLHENDIILQVDGQDIDEKHSLSSIIAQHAAGDAIQLKISRAGQEQTITATLEELKQ